MSLSFLGPPSLTPAALCREASEAVQHLLTSESPYLHLTAQQPTDPTTNGWVFNLDKYGPDWRKSESYDVTLQDVFDWQYKTMRCALVRGVALPQTRTASNQVSAEEEAEVVRDVTATEDVQNVVKAQRSASQPLAGSVPMYSAPLPQMTGRTTNLMHRNSKRVSFDPPVFSRRDPLPVRIPQLLPPEAVFEHRFSNHHQMAPVACKRYRNMNQPRTGFSRFHHFCNSAPYTSRRPEIPMLHPVRPFHMPRYQ